ncbi:MAG: exodeoxyribonuclease V subunit alpha [Pseudomonadota bacterium]
MWHKPLPPSVERARQTGWLRPIDVALVQFLQQQVDGADEIALAAAALASQQLSLGHTCLDLDLDNAQSLMGEPPRALFEEDGDPDLENLATTLLEWGRERVQRTLEASAFVGRPGDDKPLVLDDNRLYLHSQWSAESRVARTLAQRIQNALKSNEAPAERSTVLDQLFPPTENGDQTDWQKIACANALRGHFSIITGGPGTGKTTTVVKVLCALIAQRPERPLRIHMAAPTGKAAARMQESINSALNSDVIDPKWHEQLQLKASTIHRLLGVLPGSRHFRHNERHPLLCDVVIVDEASMIALDQMDSLLRALPDTAQLVLLGDKDQLASVEAGAVMGDLCQGAGDNQYLPAHADWLQSVSGEPIEDKYIHPQGQKRLQTVTLLRQSHRFGTHSGIGQLAEAVNLGASQSIDGLFSGYDDIATVSLGEWRGLCRLGHAEMGTPGYAQYLQQLRDQRPPDDAPQADFDQWARALLEQRNRFQLLCALRRGEWGVETVNRAIETDLEHHQLLNIERHSDDSNEHYWYEGRPIMVQQNDYAVGLMNGDTGLVLRKPDAEGQPRLYAVFPDGDSGLRWLAPSRLSSVETAFAITVHKSQGSEFEHCALLMPPVDSPVLSRELVYTAITRARARFSLCCSDTALLKLLSGRPTQRASGLQQQLERFLNE